MSMCSNASLGMVEMLFPSQTSRWQEGKIWSILQCEKPQGEPALHQHVAEVSDRKVTEKIFPLSNIRVSDSKMLRVPQGEAVMKPFIRC